MNRDNDRDRIYLDVIEFAKKALEAEIKALEGHSKEISDLNTNPISPDIYAKIRFIKRTHLWYANRKLSISDVSNVSRLANLRRDLQVLTDLEEQIQLKSNEIQGLKDAIAKIKNNTTLTQAQKDAQISAKEDDIEDKEEEIVDIMEPFFTPKYENVYEGTSNTFEVKNGESQFKKIISQTEKYKKMEDKIAALDEKVNLYTIKRRNQGRKVNGQERALENRLRILREKQVKKKSKEKLVMMRRQMVVDKRNKKLAKLSSKSFYSTSQGNLRRAARLDKRVEKLKEKKIRQPRGNTIMFTEFMKAFATKRKYDKDGNIEKRNWVDRRLEALQTKTTRSF